MEGQGISANQFYGKRELIAPALRSCKGLEAALGANRRDPTRLFKVLTTQDQAFKFSDARPELQLQTWSYEFDGNGKRGFVVASLSTFWRRYRQWIRHDNQLHFYEVIRNGSACRLYFDLEYRRAENKEVDPLELVRVLKLTVGTLCSRDVSAVVELDSTTEEKWSKHLIFQNVCFHDNIQAGEFARKVCTEMEAKYPGLLMVRNSSDQAVPFIDLAVYTRNRCFRLIGSSKYGKCARLLPENHNKEGRLSISETLFFNSLVCNVSKDAKLLGSPMPVRDEKFVRRRYIRGSHGSCPLRSEGDSTSSSEFKSIDEYIMSLVGPYRGGIYGVTHFRGSGTLMYAIRGGYKYCARIGRHHKSNNVILIADVPTRKMYQKCFDPDCRDFCSEPWDIPDQVFGCNERVKRGINEEIIGDSISDTALCRMMDELDSNIWTQNPDAVPQNQAGTAAPAVPLRADMGLSDDILNAMMDEFENSPL